MSNTTLNSAAIKLLESEEPFTFDLWLICNGNNLERAINNLQPCPDHGLFNVVSLEQPECGDDPCISDLAVWDGTFELRNGIPFYVGADGPGGGSGATRLRAVSNYDTLYISM